MHIAKRVIPNNENIIVHTTWVGHESISLNAIGISKYMLK